MSIRQRILLFCSLWAATLQPLHAEEATRWYVVPEKSKIEFTAYQGKTPIKGHFKAYHLKITTPNGNTEKAKIRSTLSINNIRTEKPKILRVLKSPDWFDAQRYQIANFASSKIFHLAEDNYAAEGMLTIKKKSAPVAVHFSLEKLADGKVKATGETTIDRTLFNVGVAPWSGGDLIKREVTVRFELMLQDQPYTPPLRPKK